MKNTKGKNKLLQQKTIIISNQQNNYQFHAENYNMVIKQHHQRFQS